LIEIQLLFVIVSFGTIVQADFGTNSSGQRSQTRYVVQAETAHQFAFHHQKKLETLSTALLAKFETVSFAVFHASLICQTIFFTAFTTEFNLSTIQLYISETQSFIDCRVSQNEAVKISSIS
jgi:hypothetical protein